MNERERFIRTLTCARPDRPSYGDYLAFDSTRERWEKEGLPGGLSRRQLFDYFGFDHIDIWGNLPIHSVMPGNLNPLRFSLLEPPLHLRVVVTFRKNGKVAEGLIHFLWQAAF